MALGPEVNTQLQEIVLKPGINKNNTSYGNEGGWIDGDKVRFRDGRPRKIGGWQKQSSDTVTGVARDIISWTSLDFAKYLGIGTHSNVEIFFGGDYHDITPIRASVASTNAISTSIGSNQVNVLVSSNDAQVGDSIVLRASATVGGNVFLQGTYTITSVPNANNLIIAYPSNAAATSTLSANVSGSLLLQNGLEYNQVAYGWGANAYSVSAWGTPRVASSLVTEMRQWTFDTWGEDLLACNRAGRIYVWDETSGVDARMTTIAAAPSQNNAILVSYPTRHLISLGCVSETSIFDPMLVRWSSSENYSDWNVSATGTAGFQRLEKGNKLVGAQPSKNNILVFSDTASYSMRYTGYPNIFGFDLIGQGSGLVSPHASVNIDGVVYWMSDSAFYRYDGVLRTLICTMRDVIFNPNDEDGLNQTQKDMVFAGTNQEFNEIIWFYPTRDSTQCNRYVIYNYLEDSWYDGSMDRSVWEEANIFDKPLAVSHAGVLYAHEQGMDDDSSPMDSYIASGMFDIDKGDEVMFVDKFLPDFNQQGNITLTLTTRKYPQSTETFEKTYTLSPTSGKISARARGRQMSLKVESNTTNGDFVFGKPRLALKPDGAR